VKGTSIVRFPRPGSSHEPVRDRQDAAPAPSAVASSPAGTQAAPPTTAEQAVDLERRRDALKARVAEMQWDLGGLVYEMAIRDRIRVDVLVKRAALLQDADSELGEIERILRLEHNATAGVCASCGAPHSTGASYCWQCGQPILKQVSPDTIFS
jgi:ribosomal protein L40E